MIEKLKYFLRHPFQLPIVLICKLPYFSFIRETSDYQGKVSFEFWFKQKFLDLGGNKNAYWPVHPTSQVYDAENIIVGVDAYPGIMKGCYIQGKGGIFIGDYTQIAPNVIIVSSNHDVYDSRKHILKEVRIGKYCWIGAGAKIVSGVVLGDWTIVGAGAVVTRSYPEGYCVIGGVPAKQIRQLDKEKCIPFKNEFEYNGYIRADKFEEYRKKKFESLMITIIDYGVGNLSSIKNMLKKVGLESVITGDPVEIEDADKIIRPGIGAFDHCMLQFRESGLKETITKKVMEDKTPLLGICVGLQMLMESSEEGVEPGLGWIAGKTVKFKKEKLGDLKIPHMGWTNVKIAKDTFLTENLGDQPRFYFVHSYYVEPADKSDEMLTAFYGYEFTAAVNRENIYGAQFHPEKSHKYGMKILENFGRL